MKLINLLKKECIVPALQLKDKLEVLLKIVEIAQKSVILKDVSKEEILDAWDSLDKEEYYWVSQEKVDDCIERYCTKNEYGNYLAMSLPTIYCVETPSEIQKMIDHKKEGI